ncbi:hypothetical protein CCP2SC5_70063 [Azospirillaceae bacterium]
MKRMDFVGSESRRAALRPKGIKTYRMGKEITADSQKNRL